MYTHAFGQDLSMHANMLTTVALTLTSTFTSESGFRFQKLRLGFENGL